MVKRG